MQILAKCSIYTVAIGDCFTGCMWKRLNNDTINITRSIREDWSTLEWTGRLPSVHTTIQPVPIEIAGDHYCCNPRSRAPDGPWCLTTDPNTIDGNIVMY